MRLLEGGERSGDESWDLRRLAPSLDVTLHTVSQHSARRRRTGLVKIASCPTSVSSYSLSS